MLFFFFLLMIEEESQKLLARTGAEFQDTGSFKRNSFTG